LGPSHSKIDFFKRLQNKPFKGIALYTTIDTINRHIGCAGLYILKQVAFQGIGTSINK